MNRHALLSPSSAHRWLSCPPSARLCAALPDEPSPYAQEGTCAHELCAFLVEQALGRPVTDPTEHLDCYDAGMRACAEGYAAFVLEELEQAGQTCPDPLVLVEQRVDFSHWVPDGSGTADCVLLADSTAEIIDYKHGLGVLVSAESEAFGGNPQLMCYALGVLALFDGIYNIDAVKLAIYQPRREHVSTHTMRKDELLRWAEGTLAPTAALAADGKGEFAAGDHCRFCKAKATCRKRAEHNLLLARYDFRMPDTLEDTEVDAILERADQLASWAADIKEYALKQALRGTEYSHFKVVEGRSTRRYTDEAAVARVVAEAGFDPYETSVRGVTAMTGLLGRQRFEELLGPLTCKPPGRPVLVPRSDRRPAIGSCAQTDFEQAKEK